VLTVASVTVNWGRSSAAKGDPRRKLARGLAQGPSALVEDGTVSPGRQILANSFRRAIRANSCSAPGATAERDRTQRRRWGRGRIQAGSFHRGRPRDRIGLKPR